MSSSAAVGFTAGGIDVSSIVSGLMNVERLAGDKLVSRQNELKLKSDAMGRMRTTLQSLRTAADNVVTKGVVRLSSTVSNPGAVTAAVGSAATVGTTSFTVDRLAGNHGIRASLPVPSVSSPATAAARFAFSASTSRLGVGSVSADDGVAAGKYTLEVTQATQAATRTGTAVATTTTITPSSNSLSLNVNGAARTVTLASGSYTPEQLATALGAALGSDVSVRASSTGALSIATVREGSAASVQITGGSALGNLGLTVDAAATTGVDGKLKIGGGTEMTVTETGAGSTVTASVGGGTLTLSPTSGLRVGTSTVNVVDTGDKTLGALVTAVNAANGGVTAGAVKQAEGAWYFQLQSGTSGAAGALAVPPGSWTTMTAAQDAQITVGSGTGALTITSSTNTFTDVMPGTTLTVSAVTTTPVTVGVARDDNGTADAVQALITAANAVIGEVQMQTKYDATTKKGSPLTGNSVVRAIADQVRLAVNDAVAGSTLSSAGALGIKTERDGTLAFDRNVFLDALRSNPTAVERMFTRGGTTGAAANFSGADDVTAAGTYAVNITTAATRANSGVLLAGGSPAARVVGVRVGSTVATANVPAGASAASIADALNASLAASRLNATATVDAGGVRLVAGAYGAAGNFEVNLDLSGAGSWDSYAGTDVQGTIDGQVATGLGQILSLSATSTSAAKGLRVSVTEGQTGALNDVSYAPGSAARLSALIAGLTGDNGSFTTSLASYDARYKEYTEQISSFEDKMIAKEDALRRQWARVQSTLAGLESQQTWIQQQAKALAGSQE